MSNSETEDRSIIVVSGLPRSGTSMLMQVLEAGGLSLLCDYKRRPDPDNPRGYYELEKVKTLPKDSSWLGEAEGKAVKIVSMLLYDLPPERHYKIVFVLRALTEVLASQATMLARRGEGTVSAEDSKMRRHYERHLRKLNTWLAEQENMEVFYCDYNAMLRDPEAELARLLDFLGAHLNKYAMLQAIDPSLYRQRTSLMATQLLEIDECGPDAS